ncbi:hypothetical protein [Nostoc sp. 106C]
MARNQKRDRRVPEEIILRMHCQLRDTRLIRFSQLRKYGNCAHHASENPT